MYICNAQQLHYTQVHDCVFNDSSCTCHFCAMQCTCMQPAIGENLMTGTRGVQRTWLRTPYAVLYRSAILKYNITCWALNVIYCPGNLTPCLSMVARLNWNNWCMTPLYSCTLLYMYTIVQGDSEVLGGRGRCGKCARRAGKVQAIPINNIPLERELDLLTNHQILARCMQCLFRNERVKLIRSNYTRNPDLKINANGTRDRPL
jgi:hypothetical protein